MIPTSWVQWLVLGILWVSIPVIPLVGGWYEKRHPL